MTPDMADAHETARERDARAKAGHPIEWFVYDETQTFTREHLTEWLHVYLAPANPRPGDVVQYLGHATTQARDAAWMLGALNGTGGPRDRTHDDQETDTMTDQPEPYDFHDEAHRALLNDNLSKGWQASLHALLAIHDTLTEIRDRMPERVEARVAPFDPDVIAANLKAIKHEAETPMRGHGECCPTERTDWLDEPIPVPRPEPVDESVCGNMESNTCDFPCAKPPHGDDEWHDSGRGYRWRVDEPAAPADVDPDEALAKVAFGEYMLSPSWDEAEPDMRKAWLGVARAAREHIEANQLYAYRPVAAERDKAEADLARMTDARDRHSRAADKWCNLYADKCEEVESAQAKADRYDALRADVEAQLWIARTSNFRYTIERFESILARDDERAKRNSR